MLDPVRIGTPPPQPLAPFTSLLYPEVSEFLGRDRYARGERGREGHRNGYQPARVETTAGEMKLHQPKVRGTLEAFSSRLLVVE